MIGVRGTDGVVTLDFDDYLTRVVWVRAARLNQEADIDTAEGTVRAGEGNWVVLGEGGGLSVYTFDKFNELYASKWEDRDD